MLVQDVEGPKDAHLKLIIMVDVVEQSIKAEVRVPEGEQLLFGKVVGLVYDKDGNYIGHPNEKSFYFCGRSSLKDFSYCKLHLLYAYQPKGKKEEATDKEEVPEFIEKKIQTA